MSDLFTHAKGDLKETIKGLLERHPALRDNDNALVSNIWTAEIPPGINIYDFLNGLAADLNPLNLSSFKSIVRYRAMLQEEYPELRGRRYMARRAEELEIKHKIKEGGI